MYIARFAFVGLLGMGGLLSALAGDVPGELSLLQIQKILARQKFVDLTHSFAPGIPHWHGFPDEKRETFYWYEKGRGTLGEGFFAESYTHVGQWGTHVDPPTHFIRGLRTVDQIPLQEMVLPLVVIDVHAEVAKNPDYTLSLARVQKWEAKHGAIPTGAFVAMRTDWSKRWPDGAAMENKDAARVAHYPGWTMAALKYFMKSARSPHQGTRRRIQIRESRPPRTTSRSKRTFSARIIIRSSCSQTWIKCRKQALSSS